MERMAHRCHSGTDRFRLFKGNGADVCHAGATGQNAHARRLDLEIDGVNTLLRPVQDSRNVMRVLSLEARYRIFKKDKLRAIRAIESMVTLRNAFDSRSFFVSEFSLIALQGVLLSTVQESMTFEFGTKMK